jgi:hypothetical protein
MATGVLAMQCQFADLDCRQEDPSCSVEAITILSLATSGDESNSTENSVVPTKIYLIGSSTTVGSGVLGNRAATTTSCQNRRTTNFPGLQCSSDLAFLSYSADALIDAPANHGVPDTVPIVSVTESTIDSDWPGLFDGAILQSVNAAGVNTVVTSYWTGTAADGSTDLNCTDWASPGGTGNRGFRTNTDGAWLNNSQVACNSGPQIFLCICW